MPPIPRDPCQHDVCSVHSFSNCSSRTIYFLKFIANVLVNIIYYSVLHSLLGPANMTFVVLSTTYLPQSSFIELTSHDRPTRGRNLGGDRGDGPSQKFGVGGQRCQYPPQISIVTRVTNRYNFIQNTDLSPL